MRSRWRLRIDGDERCEAQPTRRFKKEHMKREARSGGDKLEGGWWWRGAQIIWKSTTINREPFQQTLKGKLHLLLHKAATQAIVDPIAKAQRPVITNFKPPPRLRKAIKPPRVVGWAWTSEPKTATHTHTWRRQRTHTHTCAALCGIPPWSTRHRSTLSTPRL